jgi:hypothetical protein
VYVSQYKNVILYPHSTFYWGFTLCAVSLNRMAWQVGTHHREETSGSVCRIDGKGMFLSNLPTYWTVLTSGTGGYNANDLCRNGKTNFINQFIRFV